MLRSTRSRDGLGGDRLPNSATMESLDGGTAATSAVGFSAATMGGGGGTAAGAIAGIGAGRTISGTNAAPPPLCGPSPLLFHRVSVDPTGTFVAACAPGLSRVQIFKMVVGGGSAVAATSSGASAMGTRIITSRDDPRLQEQLDAIGGGDTGGRGEGGFRAAAPSPAVSFQFLCESGEQMGGVIDMRWAHPTAGILLAISCSDRFIHVLKLSRSADGTPALETTARAPRGFSILLKDVALSIAFPSVRRPTPLLAMGLNNGAVIISSIVGSEKREAHIPLGDAAIGAVGVAGGAIGGSASSPVAGSPIGSASSMAAAADASRGPPATAIAWSPSAAEAGYVLAVGFGNGVCVVARIDQSYQVLLRLGSFGVGRGLSSPLSHLPTLQPPSSSPPPPPPPAAGPPPPPITCVAWAPPLGKRVHTIAVCVGGAVSVAAVVPTMGIQKRDGGFTMASMALKGVVTIGGGDDGPAAAAGDGAFLGAARLAWSKDGEQLAVSCADNRTVMMAKARIGDELSWAINTRL